MAEENEKEHAKIFFFVMDEYLPLLSAYQVLLLVHFFVNIS